MGQDFLDSSKNEKCGSRAEKIVIADPDPSSVADWEYKNRISGSTGTGTGMLSWLCNFKLPKK